MQSKPQIKGMFFKVASLPAFKNIIILLGIVVAMAIGFFTLHAKNGPYSLSFIDSRNAGSNIRVVHAETLEVETMPEVIIYDRNFELVLSANLITISSYEKEHLDRLLKVCDLLFLNDNAAIYQLDK